MRNILFQLMFISLPMGLFAQPWIPDAGDGNYNNPIIHADYSDPDVLRHGDDFYMVASSFNVAPGLPVLHSKDLVNWSIVNHVFKDQIPADSFNIPQHGNGTWAPSIRFYNGEFFVFWGDPDYGIYMSKTRDPLGKWDPVVLVHKGKGWIDACPLWDEDGKAYLVHAFAGSRSGMKSILVVHRMDPSGTKLLDDGVLVFDGHANHPTIEGPKFYKRNGYYYIFAPAGGVSTGWQTILRSKNVFGPYEEKIVLQQGNTEINGPHQGAWVELANHDSWFIHFQDKGAYGRITHMQPMNWKEDWPVMGIDSNKDGIGEPVLSYKKPNVGITPEIKVPQTSDEFNDTKTGLQWQWNANFKTEWMFNSGNLGFMRLYCHLLPENTLNYWMTPHLFLQKFPAEEFSATTKLEFSHHLEGDKTGLMIMGMDYAYIGAFRKEGKLFLGQFVCEDAINGAPEKLNEEIQIDNNTVWLKVNVEKNAICSFSYSLNGKKFNALGNSFKAEKGKWIGARVGLFASSTENTNDKGYADFDWFRIK